MMKDTLKLIDFIKNNEDWETKLSQSPYCINIVRDDDLILFKYGIGSDFNLEIVQECRGIILNSSFVPVCVPFYKFGNFAESYVPNIDWSTAQVQEKVDGSIIKLFYYKDQWRVATNGVIDAFKASNMINTTTYGKMFSEAAKRAKLDVSKLNKNYTYIFELIGPENRVVLEYPELDIVHIGTRNNITLQELNINIGIRKPKLYNYSTLDECIEAANKMNGDYEGFVVVDQYYNRLKVKSPKYVALSRSALNGAITYSKLYEYRCTGELEEFICYFKSYKKMADKLEKIITNFLTKAEDTCKIYKCKSYETQKEFAMDIALCPYKTYLFTWRKHMDLSVQDWLNQLPISNQIKVLKLTEYDKDLN